MGLMRSRPKPLGLGRASWNRTLGRSQSHASMTSSASALPLPGPWWSFRPHPSLPELAASRFHDKMEPSSWFWFQIYLCELYNYY